MSDSRCNHSVEYREVDGETWNVCVLCGFRELWASGQLIRSTDAEESERLDAELAARSDTGTRE